MLIGIDNNGKMAEWKHFRGVKIVLLEAKTKIVLKKSHVE